MKQIFIYRICFVMLTLISVHNILVMWNYLCHIGHKLQECQAVKTIQYFSLFRLGRTPRLGTRFSLNPETKVVS